jgi:tetraacyldisaccharide 4'-kinase
LGGSGKTPLVLWIVRHLASQGWRPAIVSRGYGGSRSAASEAPIAVEASSDPREVGDEPLLLARNAGCPVWIGADRVAACSALASAHPDCDVLVLDDGLQHYRLARDVEIAVVDARGTGNGLLFPAGPLREPRSRLREVDAVVFNGAQPVAGYGMYLEGREFVNLGNAARAIGDELGSRKVHAVAGIGEPARFFRHIEALGLEVVPHAFPDHHPYVARDLEFGDRLPVVMTEKDAVKCTFIEHEAQSRFWMVPVRAEVDPAFGALLTERLRAVKLRTGKLRGPKAA